jgi:uncharacterized protein (DUF433 family)
MDRITLEPGKRGGRPCIRGLRISVYDVLSMLSSGMTQQAVLEDFPELTQETSWQFWPTLPIASIRFIH